MNRYYKEYFGIKVTLSDGSYDYYDPCEDVPSATVDGITVINTLCHEYRIQGCVSWEKYPLCDECGCEVDIDGWCSSDCHLCAEEW